MENKNYVFYEGSDIVTMGGGMTTYSIENGTETDAELVKAFNSGDQMGVLQALDKGANMNLQLTVTQGEKSVTGNLLFHLLTQEPEKERFVQPPRYISFDKEEEARQQRAYDIACDREYSRVKKVNQQRAENMINMIDFWLDIGGSLFDVDAQNFQISRRLHVSDEAINKHVKFKSVREYIQRARDIDALVLDSINKHVNVMLGNEKVRYFKFFLEATTNFRRSGKSLDDIRKEVGLDDPENNN